MWRQQVSSHYLNGSLPYVRRHITVKENVLSASLNKTFPSYLELELRCEPSTFPTTGQGFSHCVTEAGIFKYISYGSRVGMGK